MTTLHFKVASESSDAVYELAAEPMEGGLRFSCNCPAGSLGQLCKHRLAFIAGVFPQGVKPDDKDIAILNEWLATSRVPAIIDAIAIAESNVKKAKKQLAAIKHELGRRLHDGTA